MASDFDKLFGDDWRPQEPDPEGAAPLRDLGGDANDRNLFESLNAPSDGDVNFTSETENRVPRSLNEKEVKVMGVYMHQEQGAPPQHFVLLRDNRARRVPIWVGQFEAWAISLALEGDDPVRPLTHDLVKLILDKMEATIERIVIDDLWNETFYAKITILKPGGSAMDIDARPSDAIALAIRSKAPIYIAESVLEATMKSE